MRRLLALCLVGLSLVGCGGSGDTGTNPNATSLAGTYTLKSVNGAPLPFTFQSGSNSVTVTADVLTVADGGTWTETTTYTQTINGQTTPQTGADSGTWARVGSSVTFTSPTSSGYSGTFTGAGFTLHGGALSFVFAK